jgi:peptidase E
MDDPALDRRLLDLTSARRPRICFIPTASGDHPSSSRVHEAFPDAGFDTSILRLFDREVADLTSFLGEQDLVSLSRRQLRPDQLSSNWSSLRPIRPPP